jgi:hypothetical protein
MTPRTRFVVAVVLLVGAVLAYVSGLVLLVAFHMGHGCFRPDALGLSRLVWQNLHRLGAVLAVGALLVHTVAHGKAIYLRTRRVLLGKAAGHDVRELVVSPAATSPPRCPPCAA